MSYRGTGRATVNADHPAAFAVCQRCGAWRNHVDLTWQFDFRGNSLANLQILVCKEVERCNDKPFEFFRPILVGPDPVPIKDPRPENFQADYGLQGFTPYTLWNGPFPIENLVYLYDQDGDIVVDQNGTPIVAEQGYGKMSVLTAVASLSGIAIPDPYTDWSTSITAVSTSQTLVPANVDRTWLLLYNPGSIPLAISISGAAVLGVRPSIVLGFGEAMFWATAQGGQPVTQNAVTVAGPFAGASAWAWEA